MACPFARLMGVNHGSTTPSIVASHASIHHAHRAKPLARQSTMPLTSMLKQATWPAHRAIERSPGVAALMGTGTGSGSHLTLERMDYVRFLVMLACIYAPMEATMLKGEEQRADKVDAAVATATGLDSSNKVNFEGVATQLARTPAIMRDVQAHIDELCGAPSSIDELCDYVADDDTENDVKEKRDVIAETTCRAMDFLRIAMSAKACAIEPEALSAFSPTHVELLNAQQVDALFPYVERLGVIAAAGASVTSTACDDPSPSHASAHYDEGVSLTPPLESWSPLSSRNASPAPAIADGSPPSSPALLTRLVSAASYFFPKPTPTFSAKDDATSTGVDATLIAAHVYVRYMGDLSGGQHMVKRLSKLFPIHRDETDSDGRLREDTGNAGFEFYNFVEPTNLKDRLRSVIDGMTVNPAQAAALGREAALVFVLNHAILDSLVDSAVVDIV